MKNNPLICCLKSSCLKTTSIVHFMSCLYGCMIAQSSTNWFAHITSFATQNLELHIHSKMYFNTLHNYTKFFMINVISCVFWTFAYQISHYCILRLNNKIYIITKHYREWPSIIDCKHSLPIAKDGCCFKFYTSFL
jgi:hypothetical protein